MHLSWFLVNGSPTMIPGYCNSPMVPVQTRYDMDTDTARYPLPNSFPFACITQTQRRKREREREREEKQEKKGIPAPTSPQHHHRRLPSSVSPHLSYHQGAEKRDKAPFLIFILTSSRESVPHSTLISSVSHSYLKVCLPLLFKREARHMFSCALQIESSSASYNNIKKKKKTAAK